MRFLKYIFWLGFLFQAVPAAAVRINLFAEKVIPFSVSYTLSDYLHERNREVRQIMKESLGKPLQAVDFKEILNRITSESPEGRIFLTYLYLDKWLSGRSSEYTSYFSDVDLTAKDSDDIKKRLLGGKKSSPEWHLIEGYKQFLFVPHARNDSSRMDMLLSGLHNFRQAQSMDSEKSVPDFEFVWNFSLLEASAHVVVDSEVLSEAERNILNLATEGYAPAQLLQGFLNTIKGDSAVAAAWFEKSHRQGYFPIISSVFLGIPVMNGDKRALPYLEEAVFGHHHYALQPLLEEAYIAFGQYREAFFVSRNIAEDYPRFRLPMTLLSMGLMCFFLCEGLGVEEDLETAYIWLHRRQLLEKETRLILNPASSGVLLKSASADRTGSSSFSQSEPILKSFPTESDFEMLDSERRFKLRKEAEKQHELAKRRFQEKDQRHTEARENSQMALLREISQTPPDCENALH